MKHADWPLEGWYVPSAQVCGLAEPVGQYVPAEQRYEGVGDVMPDGQ